MKTKGMNILFAGVGGQGVLLLSELVALAAIKAGFDAKKTEVHGAAQRGGSVTSHVRFSDKVHSPLTPSGEVDLLVGLEKLEALRWAHYLKEKGEIVLNQLVIQPAQFSEKPLPYPREVEAFLRGKGYSLHLLDATAIAKKLGNIRVANVVILGALSRLTDLIDEALWTETIREILPARFLDVNLKAFQLGRDMG
jgi:indolepyruvate ferredoxin oxidoreductase beta subunit